MARTPFGVLSFEPPPVHRGGGNYSPGKFRCKSGRITHSWGSEPATATLVYLSQAPVVTGSQVILDIAGHTFYGHCLSDAPTQSSKGNQRTLQFVDNRDYLEWDIAYCAFNKPDEHLVDGIREKRYKHCLPANFSDRIFTFTDSAYSAKQICDFLFKAPTTEDAWRRSYHASMNLPVFDLDFMGGETLRSALQTVSDKLGLVFTLSGSPFRLVWCRKGEGALPAIPSLSDDREDGLILSRNPSRIRILGDRNLYQVHNIPMVRDWKAAWEAFFDWNLFLENIYQNGVTKSETVIGTHRYPAGTRFNAIGSAAVSGVFVDKEQVISRQLARARALEITVREYATLVGDDSFLDVRKYGGRSRLDMPAALYIRHILFRAFRFPDNFKIRNANGRLVPISSLSIASKMVAKVSHDPITGSMDWDPDQNADGNGYAIVRGYQVGQDLFRTIKPDRFDFKAWTDAQNIWQQIEFQVDDSGEEASEYILFDEPVIKSGDLVTMVDGYAVFKARPTFTIPDVRIAITFAAENFSFVKGRGTRDDKENIPGLNSLFTSDYADASDAIDEVPYSDGLLASQKAEILADSLLARQFIYRKGKYTQWIRRNPNGTFPAGVELSPLIDRVELSFSSGGCSQEIEFTSERPRMNFVPERDLDRNTRAKQLLPGQAQLRHEADIALITANALSQSADAKKTVTDAFKSMFGSSEPVDNVPIKGKPGATVTLPVGSVLRKKPREFTGGVSTQSLATLPELTDSTHTEFVGVTVREGEQVAETNGEVPLQRTGDIFARVKGPVKAGDVVGMVNAENNLSTTGTGTVGKALEEITTAIVRLIKVRTSSAAAQASGFPYQIIKAGDNVMVAPGYLLNGLDAKAKTNVSGIREPFAIVSESDIIYIETLFDVNAKPFAANICRATTWDPGVFPKLTLSVRGSDSPNFADSFWVKANPTALAAMESNFTAFDTKRRQWKCFTVIGYVVKGVVEGAVAVTVADVPCSIVQALDTNLMLASFCEAGIPVYAAIPYNAPIIERLPTPTRIITLTAGINLEVTGFPNATIYYTIDGSEPTSLSPVYAGPYGAQPSDTTVKAFAAQVGYYDSEVLTFVIA